MVSDAAIMIDAKAINFTDFDKITVEEHIDWNNRRDNEESNGYTRKENHPSGTPQMIDFLYPWSIEKELFFGNHVYEIDSYTIKNLIYFL